MSRREALSNFISDVIEDGRDYRLLRAFLQEQFEAAMKHNASRLKDLAGQITEVVGVLEKRRARRSELMVSLAGKGAGIADILTFLQDAAREAMKERWDALEGLVRECKELNERNCRFMMDQYDIMNRVLHGEDEIYVPV